MHVLVFGASGQTGARVVEACLARGARVSAFVRSPARFAARDGVSVVGGDARDDAAVRDALAGVAPCCAASACMTSACRPPIFPTACARSSAR